MDYIARHYNMDLASRWRAGPWCSASCDGARDRKKRLFIDKRIGRILTPV